MKLSALTENSWVLGGRSRVSIPHPGFWHDNAPPKYRDHKFTDPRIPKEVILKVAHKHPNGLSGARSAVQSFINLGSAKGASMRRLRQIAKWLSDEIQRNKD
jgi:hypothetical protein